MKKRLLGGLARPYISRGDAYISTVDLIDVINDPSLAPETGFWMRYFPRVFNSTAEKIMFDEIDDNEYRMAPFVLPHVQGVPMAAKGFQTRSFRPAYLKPKHVVDPSRAITRRAGEAPLGTLSPAQRFDIILADNLRRERAMIYNRWDWMACQAVVTGKCVIKGENYPTTTVDFGRDSGLTSVLSGGALWTADTATPIADVQSMSDLSYKLSRSPITDLIFGQDAFAAFLLPTHGDVQGLLNTLLRGNESLFNASGITDGSPFVFQGNLVGTGGIGLKRMWTYVNYYESLGDSVEDTAGLGVGVPYFDTNTVVGVGSGLRGVQAFGAIMDRQAGLAPLSLFPRMWDNEDPSVTYTMTQSAPLMIPMRPDNSFSLKVAS